MVTNVTTEISSLLQVNQVTMHYKTRDRLVTATRDVSFEMNEGERVILLGPSGCGKSTLLKGIGGFLHPVSGSITLKGRRITGPGPDRVAVFQEFDQLLPWKTVLQNIAFALTASRRATGPKALEIAEEYGRRVNLGNFLNSYPHTLSGGMKQRVAIARCLAMRPDIILMDEPFAALDALTRQQMQTELLALWNEVKFSMLFVTHSIDEAIRLGHRIVMLSPHPGRVRKIIDIGKDVLADDNQTEFREIHEATQKTLFKDVIDYAI